MFLKRAFFLPTGSHRLHLRQEERREAVPSKASRPGKEERRRLSDRHRRRQTPLHQNRSISQSASITSENSAKLAFKFIHFLVASTQKTRGFKNSWIRIACRGPRGSLVRLFVCLNAVCTHLVGHRDAEGRPGTLTVL